MDICMPWYACRSQAITLWNQFPLLSFEFKDELKSSNLWQEASLAKHVMDTFL